MAGNQKYQRGVAWERAIQKRLEGEEWLVTRSAGSHGLWDLVAVNLFQREIKLIQAKTGTARVSRADRAAYKTLRGHFYVFPEIHTKRLRREPLIEQL